MTDFSEALAVGVDDALASHSNTFDLRVPAQCKFWLEELPGEVRKFIVRGGYRLYPERARIRQNRRSFTVRHVWANCGVGVLPNRHPNWNRKYQVSFCLLDAVTKEVKFIYTDTGVEPSDWLKGSVYTYASVFDVSEDLSAGNYYLGVGITDRTKGSLPGIRLALPPGNTVNGWAVLTSIML